MTDLEFLEKEIAAWKCSPRRMMQIKGFLYYDGDHDVIHRKRTMIGEGGELEVVENLPNNRIVDNQYAKMVNQKANYLFGKPFTLSGENTAYIELLKKIFDKKFMRTLKSAGKAAYNGGYIHTTMNGVNLLSGFSPLMRFCHFGKILNILNLISSSGIM